MRNFVAIGLAGIVLAAGAAIAHDTRKPAETPVSAPALAQAPAMTLPFQQDIGGDFDLVDHFGKRRTLANYKGRHLLIFFGYAGCQSICSAALPLMGAVLDALGGDDAGREVAPVMITIDPARDTPQVLRAAMPQHHPALVGLTGSEEELARVREAFQVEISEVAEDFDGLPIYAHGSFIYLLGPDGNLDTLIPPVIGPDRMAEIIKTYL